MIIVIADNFSGAAEIAGIGHAHGLSTSLLTDLGNGLPVCDLLVIATNTRSMTEPEAVATTHTICQQIKMGLPQLSDARRAALTPLQRAQNTAYMNETLHIYKMTDPLLRGHVHLELRALVEESRYEQVMYLPANPSKGNSIRGGRYYVEGTPIDQTALKKDPDFPILTANVADAIGVRPGSRLRICDAEDMQDVRRTTKLALMNRTPTLLAGSSDLFSALLLELGHKMGRHKQFGGLSEKGVSLILCGSALSIDISKKPYIQRHGMAVAPMPREVFDSIASHSLSIQDATDRWMGRLKQAQIVSSKAASFVLTMPYPSIGSSESALALRNVTAEMAKRLASQSQLTELVIEGGDTAFTALQKLGWTRFAVTQQITPSAIRMQCLDAPHTYLTFKPGGADWGDVFV